MDQGLSVDPVNSKGKAFLGNTANLSVGNFTQDFLLIGVRIEKTSIVIFLFTKYNAPK